jgi:uncharacterized protein
MKFTLDARSDINLIRGYGTGVVRVGEQTLHKPCIVAANALLTQWQAPSVELLAPEHLQEVFELRPEVALLGTGATQRFPSKIVRQAFTARGVALETMDLGAACRTYNILVQEERRVVALLFLS